jgi:sodium-dependent dicarboxylate transporter 2/3/5
MKNQEAIPSKKKGTKYLVNAAITILIMVFFGFISPPEPITADGMKVLGILIGAIYGWTTVGGVWPSLLALVLLGFTGSNTVTGIFTSAIGSYLMIYLMLLLIMVAVVSGTGVTKAIALRMINSKIAKGRPWVLTTVILLATILLAATTSGLATALVMWGILEEISSSVGYEKYEKWPVLMVFGIAFIALGANMILPFQSTIISQTGIFTGMYADFNLPFGSYILFSLSLVAILTVLFLLVSRFILKPDVEKIAQYEPQTDIAPFTFEQKFAIGMIFGFVIFILVPMLLPATSAVKVFFTRLSALGVLAVLLVCAMLLHKKGKKVFDFSEVARRGFVWPMFFMIATAVKASSVMLSADTGISSFLINTLTPIFGGMSEFVFIVVLSLFAIVLTNFMNNSILGITCLSLLASFMTVLGINSVLAFAIFTWASSFGFLLPSASPYGALLYGKTDMIRTKDIMKYSVIFVPIALLVLILVGIPLGRLLF